MAVKARKIFNMRTCLWLGVATLSLSPVNGAWAQPAGTQQIDIPSQSLALTLKQIGRQTHSEILYSATDVQGKQSPALQGTYTAQEALAAALRGTSLYVERTPQGAYVIRSSSVSGNSGTADPAVSAELESSDIIVTARKADERIQDVPVSLTAVTGETLRDRGAADIKDILRNVPGLANTGTDRGLSRYTIRGLSSFASAPTVGIYLDDVPLVTIATTFSGGYDAAFFDMQRVEVLKGPQGTLYGGSAMGGAIKYVSNTPNLKRFSVDTSAGLSFTAHGAPSYTADVVVNAPFIEDVLALRAGFQYRHEGGIIDNMPGDVRDSASSSTDYPVYTPVTQDALTTRRTKNQNYGDTFVGRLSLEWQPDESWSIRPQIFYQDYKQGDSGYFFINRPGFTSSFRIPQPNYDRASIYSLNIEKELGGVKATSLTSYYDRRFIYIRDYSFFVGGLVPSLFPLTSYNNSTSNTKTFSQEFRLASDNGDAPLKWLVGAFYSNQDDRLVQWVDTFGAAAIFGEDRLYFGDTFTKTKQYALFGEATYTLFDNFDVTAGVRLFKIKQRIDAIYDGLFNGGFTEVDGKKSKEDGINPKFGLSYKLTRDNLIFASAAKGFRPGGPNRYNINPAVCGGDLALLGLTEAPSTFKSDNLWTYEAGTKNQFAGGKATLNASAYYTKWKGIQQQIGLACGFGFTSNIGAAEVKGLELEASVEPFKGFQIGGTAGYVKTRVTDAAPGTGTDVGDQLPGVPKWTATAYVGYETDLSNDWRFDIRAEYQYQGTAVYTGASTIPATFPDGSVAEVPDPLGYRHSYQVVNLFTSFGNGATKIRLFANNIFDVRPLLDVDLYSKSDRSMSIRPRTIGVSVRQSF